jgi:uncharacterized protein YndB with AHSA1/START domain
MAHNEIHVDAAPESVFDVLADPRSYARWVVGSKQIRAADSAWPAAGATFDHSVGVGPLVVHDGTTVRASDRPRRLELLVRVRPFTQAVVTLRLYADADGTRVEMDEHPVDRRSRLMLFNPLTEAAAPAPQRGVASPTQDARRRLRADPDGHLALARQPTGGRGEGQLAAGRAVELTRAPGALADQPDGTHEPEGSRRIGQRRGARTYASASIRRSRTHRRGRTAVDWPDDELIVGMAHKTLYALVHPDPDLLSRSGRRRHSHHLECMSLDERRRVSFGGALRLHDATDRASSRKRCSTLSGTEGQGVGQSGCLENAVDVPRPGSQRELHPAPAGFTIEPDDHAHAGGVDEFQLAEVKLDPAQAGSLQRPFQRGLHRERRLHVELAGERRGHYVAVSGDRNGQGVGAGHMAGAAR